MCQAAKLFAMPVTPLHEMGRDVPGSLAAELFAMPITPLHITKSDPEVPHSLPDLPPPGTSKEDSEISVLLDDSLRALQQSAGAPRGKEAGGGGTGAAVPMPCQQMLRLRTKAPGISVGLGKNKSKGSASKKWGHRAGCAHGSGVMMAKRVSCKVCTSIEQQGPGWASWQGKGPLHVCQDSNVGLQWGEGQFIKQSTLLMKYFFVKIFIDLPRVRVEKGKERVPNAFLLRLPEHVPKSEDCALALQSSEQGHAFRAVPILSPGAARLGNTEGLFGIGAAGGDTGGGRESCAACALFGDRVAVLKRDARDKNALAKTQQRQGRGGENWEAKIHLPSEVCSEMLSPGTVVAAPRGVEAERDGDAWTQTQTFNHTHPIWGISYSDRSSGLLAGAGGSASKSLEVFPLMLAGCSLNKRPCLWEEEPPLRIWVKLGGCRSSPVRDQTPHCSSQGCALLGAAADEARAAQEHFSVPTVVCSQGMS
ncbi:hypothetical protein Anapl_07640 [Anas platyrhynchos]|uniref:Uncharacterized protein n=1 Tax=Anas platyrhynchos TaxID=8839 RepID=R0LDW8_ANAPL|nr:hypothetical protein Anapl_07640 [Anas platyrhynchos]